MNIAHSTFYYKNKARSSDRMKTEANLRDRIEAMCLEFPCYGYRRVTRLPYVIEEVYNRKRLHSALDYRPPNELEEMMLIQQTKQAFCQALLTLPVQS